MVPVVKVTLIFVIALVIPVSALWKAQPSLAQAKFKSGISGRVTDPNGAVIVGVSISLVGRTTKKLVQVSTNDSGEYTADLEPELYDVKAESHGFKTAKRRNIPVHTEARSFVDFMLVPNEN